MAWNKRVEKKNHLTKKALLWLRGHPHVFTCLTFWGGGWTVLLLNCEGEDESYSDESHSPVLFFYCHSFELSALTLQATMETAVPMFAPSTHVSIKLCVPASPAHPMATPVSVPTTTLGPTARTSELPTATLGKDIYVYEYVCEYANVPIPATILLVSVGRKRFLKEWCACC